LLGYSELLLISNVQEADRKVGIHDDGKEWHADSTYATSPSLASFLYAKEAPHDESDNPLS
jgi:alpha-ketoglutarate-dependent taurine dioxygenase